MCNVHYMTEIWKRLCLSLLEVGERQKFAFQHESAINLNYVSLKS